MGILALGVNDVTGEGFEALPFLSEECQKYRVFLTFELVESIRAIGSGEVGAELLVCVIVLMSEKEIS